MAQSDARFGYKAKLSRENHELSQPFGFSTAPGMLNPIFADVASPGDSYYINHDLEFLRTAPLAAPAMVDVYVHYESFFVPMQMIYQPFENSFFSLKQIYSSMYTDTLFQNLNLPTYDYFYNLSHIIHDYPQGAQRSLAFRLCDLLDLQAINFCNLSSQLDSSNKYLATESFTDLKYHPSFFPWQILAYHTIYQYYYRLDDKSDFNNTCCNFDIYYDQTTPVQMINSFLTIYQRPWNFDYFTSMYRSPIVSDANLQSVLSSGSYSDLISGTTTPINDSRITPTYNSDYRGFSTAVLSSPSQAQVQGATSTALIRQAFANEKLAMITGRTRKNYDSQVLAHFGVDVPKDIKHDITLIGKDTYKLHVGEVTSLASTEDSALGDLAGKGYTAGKGHDIKFKAPCHGVVMTIFSVEPIKRYFGGFNRYNAVSSVLNLPIPEYDRLGNVPMYQYETGSAQAILNQNMTDICGFKERYYEWKRRKPRVSLAFMGVGQSQAISLSGNNTWEPYFISSWAFGAHGATQNTLPKNENRFYIEPECMDGLMLVPMRLRWGTGGSTQSPDEDWNADPCLVYSHDPFIVDSNLKVKKVSWMSKDGEPIYPY